MCFGVVFEVPRGGILRMRPNSALCRHGRRIWPVVWQPIGAKSDRQDLYELRARHLSGACRILLIASANRGVRTRSSALSLDLRWNSVNQVRIRGEQLDGGHE